YQYTSYWSYRSYRYTSYRSYRCISSYRYTSISQIDTHENTIRFAHDTQKHYQPSTRAFRSALAAIACSSSLPLLDACPSPPALASIATKHIGKERREGRERRKVDQSQPPPLLALAACLSPRSLLAFIAAHRHCQEERSCRGVFISGTSSDIVCSSLSERRRPLQVDWNHFHLHHFTSYLSRPGSPSVGAIFA
ncbi:hypothetical protein Dimus_037745, partial [Dionaea muscipula]